MQSLCGVPFRNQRSVCLSRSSTFLRPVALVRRVEGSRTRRCSLPKLPVPTIVCGAGVAHPGEEAHGAGEKGFVLGNLSVPDVVMAKGGKGGGGFGAGGSMGAVLEKAKISIVMPTPPQQAPKLDDGGSGGDIGKIIHNGGGGDGGDDDDDDYFDDGEGDGDGDDEGDGFLRTIIPEQYDKFSINAVLSEWMRTVQDLPLVLKRAFEMGLFSSAQLYRFFAMDVRPNVTRAATRALPDSWARDLIGRLMADPAFVQKLVIEQAMAVTASLIYEWRARGANFKDELDLVAINTIGLAAASSAALWIVTPSRSYGSLSKLPWQQMLAELPNCVFDKSGPLKHYTQATRVSGFFARALQFSAVGALCGGLTSLATNAAVAIRHTQNPNWQPSVPVPSLATSAAGMAAFYAVNAHTRYQLLGGLDRYLFERSNYLWTYLGISTLARGLSWSVGEQSRFWWQGLPRPTGQVSSRRARKATKKVSGKRREKLAELQARSVAVDAPVVQAAATTLVEFPTESQQPIIDEPSTLSRASDSLALPSVLDVSRPLEYESVDSSLLELPQHSTLVQIAEGKPEVLELVSAVASHSLQR